MSNVIKGKEAIEGMMEGIKLATEAIRLTYGPYGTNAVIEEEFYPFHKVANDAQTIIQSIHTNNSLHKRGLSFLKELSDKADRDSGDGRKTTCIIAEEILTQGYKSEVNGLTLKKELDSFIPIIEQKIDEQKRVITPDEIDIVARVAGENESLAKILKEIYQAIGKEGIITLDNSGTPETTYKIINGVRFEDASMLSPFMVHDEEAVKEGRKETQAVYHNPRILVTKRKIAHVNDINPLLNTLIREGIKDIVIFTDDMDSGVASLMVKLHKEKQMNILIIRAPILWKNYVFEDFAKITGATIIEDASGITFKNMSLNHLGTCEKLICDSQETTVIGLADITDHIASLKVSQDPEAKRRLAWLQTKTAILRLGANSESELSYLRLKAADAINSCRLALLDGVVDGGGIALLNIANQLLNHTISAKILINALIAPRIQLARNSQDIESKESVLDAAKVVKNAVRNAIGLASTVLTTSIVITLPEKSQAQLIAEAQLASKRI